MAGRKNFPNRKLIRREKAYLNLMGRLKEEQDENNIKKMRYEAEKLEERILRGRRLCLIRQ